MKRYSLLIYIYLFVSVVLTAQTDSPPTSTVEMAPEELTAIVRRMVEMRRQRYLLYRQEYLRRAQTQVQGRVIKNRNVETRTVVSRSKASVEMDTIVTIDPNTFAQSMTVVRRESPPVDTVVTIDPNTLAVKTVEPRPVADEDRYARELADLRRQLTRQGELLETLAQQPTPDNYPSVTTPPRPYRPDTVVQRIIQRSDRTDGLSRSDLDALTREMRRMNDEMDDLRRQLRNEEDRRRRAERDLSRSIDRNRTAPVAPTVITQQPTIIRDTVVIEKTSTRPVLIPVTPPRPDTVIQVREVVRQADPVVIRDTVVREKETRVVETREVVRTDTVKLSATEPLSFPTIFFDNNSSALNANHRQLLATTARQLANNRNYELRLIGYASPSGSAAYNQQLSARRAAAVRQGLETAGLPADRIVIVPGGIDYKPASAAAARRVEIQALPR